MRATQTQKTSEHFLKVRTLRQRQIQNTSSDSEHFVKQTLVVHVYVRKSMRATQNTSSDSEHFVKTNLSGPWTISGPCICKKKYESHSDPEHFRTLPQTQNTSSDSEH